MPTDDAAAAEPGALPSQPLAPEAFREAPFPYMRWAKAHLAPSALNLGLSGLAALSAAEREELGLAPPHEFGGPESALKSALAERYGVSPEGVHLAAGTSHANFAVYLAFARGAHVAAETPAYEALHKLPDAVGAPLDSFHRRPEDDGRIDPASLAAAVRPATGLIAVTDLHNPTGLRLTDADYDLLIDAAETHDATILVDEVYADFDPEPRPTAASRHARIVTTNSLTKVHGLGDLRAGWILGTPERIHQIALWDDLVHPVLPPAPIKDALAFLKHAGARTEALRERAAERAAQVDAWVRDTPRVAWTRPHGGLTGLLRLLGPGPTDGDVIAQRARERLGITVVPGSFFQVQDALRISFLLDEVELERALDGLAAVLDEPA